MPSARFTSLRFLAGLALLLLTFPAPVWSDQILSLTARFKPRPWPPGGDAPVTAPFSIPQPGIVKMTWKVENYQSAGYSSNWPIAFRKRGSTGGGVFPALRQIGGRTLSDGAVVTVPRDGSVAVLEATYEVDRIEGWEAVLFPIATPGTWELKRQIGQKISLVMDFESKPTPSQQPAPPMNLNGTWYMGGPVNVNKECRIIQDGNRLTFVNENGLKSRGLFKNANTVVAKDWNGLVGHLNQDGTRIDWANGSWWSKRELYIR